jgi:hypothetical protein
MMHCFSSFLKLSKVMISYAEALKRHEAGYHWIILTTTFPLARPFSR